MTFDLTIIIAACALVGFVFLDWLVIQPRLANRRIQAAVDALTEMHKSNRQLATEVVRLRGGR